LCIQYIIQYWQWQYRVKAKARGAQWARHLGLYTMLPLATLYSIYCNTGGSGGNNRVPILWAMKEGSGVPKQKRCLQRIVLICAQKPQTKRLSCEGQKAPGAPFSLLSSVEGGAACPPGGRGLGLRDAVERGKTSNHLLDKETGRCVMSKHYLPPLVSYK